MEAAIWVTADGRKRLKRFSGGFSGQNRWVVGGENGISRVRLELETQRSKKVRDILGAKWLRRLKSLEKLSEALVGLWIRVVTAFLLPFSCSQRLPHFKGNLLPHFPEAQDFHLPPFACHPCHLSSPTSLSLVGRPAVSCPPTDASPASTGISRSRTFKRTDVREDLLLHLLEGKTDREETIISLRSCTALGYILFIHSALATSGGGKTAV